MRHGPSIVSSRYGTAPACFTPSLSTSVYAAITHAIRRPSGTPRPGVRPRPRTSRTPSPTRQTPTTWPAEVVCPSATTPVTRSAYSATMPIAAVVFDFNGTLSDDEPILCDIFMHLFAEHGKPLSAQEYFDRLAGLSDPEIVRTWLGNDHPDVQAVIDERVHR